MDGEAGIVEINFGKGYGGFPKLGGPDNTDYSILGSILESAYFGKLPYHGKSSSLGLA